MIYNLLQEYKKHLLKSYSRATAEAYYKCLAVLLKNQPAVDTANRLDAGLVLDKLSEIKYKNHFSQSKNALLRFCDFQNIKLSNDILVRIKELENATKRKYRQLKPIEYNQIDSKIKHIKNIKLKLSYQTMIATGLRISEVAGITPNNCIISDNANHSNSITFNFIGKGRKKGTAIITSNDSPLLYERLKDLIKNTPANKKVFYSAVYLQKKARELGFGCHDLRRAFAKLEYNKCRDKTEVSRKLGHSNIKTTNIYLKSKIKL